jgi:hypothetical protein
MKTGELCSHPLMLHNIGQLRFWQEMGPQNKIVSHSIRSRVFWISRTEDKMVAHSHSQFATAH